MAADYRSRGDALAAQRKFGAAAAQYAAALKWQPDDQDLQRRHATSQRGARKRLLVVVGSVVTTAVVIGAAWTLLVTGLRIHMDPGLRDYDQDLQVLLDGKPIVWWQQRHLMVGTHRLQALNPRYRDFLQDFTAHPMAVVDIVLHAEPRAGDLRIESKPTGAVVWVNGEARGQTPIDIKGVRVPSATIRIQKRYFKAKEQTVQIADGSSATLTYTLDRNDDQLPPLNRQVLARLFPPLSNGGTSDIDSVERGSFSEAGAAEALVQVSRGWPELWLLSADDGEWKAIRKIIEPRGLDFHIVDIENDGQNEAWIETSECHQGNCYYDYELLGLSRQADRVLFKEATEDRSNASPDFTGEGSHALSDFVDLDQDGYKELIFVIVTDKYSNGEKVGERIDARIYAIGDAGFERVSTDRFAPSPGTKGLDTNRLRVAMQQGFPRFVPLLFPDLGAYKDHAVQSVDPIWEQPVGDLWRVTARVHWSCHNPSSARPVLLDRLVSVDVSSRPDGSLAIGLPTPAQRRGESSAVATPADGQASHPMVQPITPQPNEQPGTIPQSAGANRVPIDLGAPFRDAFADSERQLRALVARTASTLATVTETKLLNEIAMIESLPRPLSHKSLSGRKLNEQGIKAITDQDPTRATAIFEAAYKDNPTDVEIVENLGYAYLSSGNLDKAEFDIILSTLMYPRRATSWHNLGQIYALRKDLPSATGCFVMAYSVSRSKDGTRRFFEKLRSDNPHEEVRAVADSAIRLIEQTGFSADQAAAAKP